MTVFYLFMHRLQYADFKVIFHISFEIYIFIQILQMPFYACMYQHGAGICWYVFVVITDICAFFWNICIFHGALFSILIWNPEWALITHNYVIY